MKLIKSVKLFLVAILIIGLALPNSTQAAVRSGDLMQINKTVSNNTVVKGETTDVTMTVKGTPKDSTFVKPNDVILIIDKSGSMRSDNRLAAAKDAAKEFIDLMDLTKHELGIVDFDTNVYSYPLTTDKTAAKAYVDTIQLGGNTNTSEAIRKATAMLQNKRPNAQPTIVIMTDGAANNEVDAKAAAKAAKDAGITFYSIALLGPNENPDTSAPNKLLKEMASSFDHHHFVLGSVGLSDVYKAIVEEIGLASAYNVTITDTISPEFELVPGSYDHHIPKPTVTGNTIEWFISELKSNELSFTYQVRAKDDAAAGKYPVAQTSTTFEMGDSSIYSLNTTNPIVEIKNHAPIITSITENKGLTTGGETVTITGQNFLPGVKVYFGSSLATIISVTDNEIVVTTPTGKQGAVDVKVENTDRQSAIGSFNYYAEPTITSITPAEGELQGGNTVTITGTNFMVGATVYIDNVATETTFITVNNLRAVVPPATESGIVSVKIINPDTTTAELTDAYTYLAPPPAPAIELDSISSTSGELAGGELVYLLGKNFDLNVKAYFGDKEATVNTYLSSSKIRVTVPEATDPSTVSVKVINPDNSSSELADSYTYLAPPPPPVLELHSLSSSNGILNGGETINLYGVNFDRNAKVFFGDIEVAAVTFLTSERLRMRVPASVSPGNVSVKVQNPDGSISVLADAYEYLTPPPLPAPEITSIVVTSILIGESKNTLIYGKNFAATSTVFFGNQQTTMTFLSPTLIRVKIPESTVPGIVDVKVVNIDNQEAVVPDAFTYTEPVPEPAPSITSISNISGPIAGNETVIITGDNFKSGAKVYFGNAAGIVLSISANEIKVRTPKSAVTGLVSVKIVNPDLQEATLQDAYTYEGLKPTITSIPANSGALKGGYNVLVYGTNFSKDMTITVGGQPTTYTFLSASQVRIRIPAGAAPGTVDLIIDLHGERAIAPFTYN